MPEKGQYLPGVEGEGVSLRKIKAVDEAFDELIGHRERRMKAGQKESDASAVLTALFHKHNLRSYTYDETKYVLKGKEKIVRAPKDDDNGADTETV